ncbi:MAG: hypothetical protein JWO41_359 [Candidatus Saccharibacteria bacterium]|nr:hypothetical protein [Candidatus Saccharibacteria bacterium]
MSLETTPSSTYTNWELPITDTEAGYWQMSMAAANTLLKEVAPFPTLAQHGEALGKQFEALETYTIDGESVMWLASSVQQGSKARVSNGSDPLEPGIRLACECDFNYRIIDRTFGKEVFRVFKAGCQARQKLITARQINVSDSLGFDARNQFRPSFPFHKLNPKPAVEEAILTIIEAATTEGEWIGNQVGGRVTVPIIQSILGMPRGGDDHEKGPALRDARWKYFHDLVAAGRVIQGPAWELKLPRKRLLRT